MFSINAYTGDIKWFLPIGFVISGPTVRKELIFVGCKEGSVYGISAEDGGVIWSRRFAHPAYVSVNCERFLPVCSGKRCYLLSTSDGKVKWSIKVNGTITSSPRLYDGCIYFGSWDGRLYAVKNGAVKWTFKTGWGIDVTPEIDSGIVYVGSNDNNFYAINSSNGELEWFFTCLSGIHSSPLVYGDLVIFGSDDGRLYALNKTNGKLAWTFSPAYKIQDKYDYITTPILSSPIAYNGTVFIGIGGFIFALDAKTIEKIKHPKTYSTFTVLAFFILPVVLLILLLLLYLYRTREEK